MSCQKPCRDRIDSLAWYIKKLPGSKIQENRALPVPSVPSGNKKFFKCLFPKAKLNNPAVFGIWLFFIYGNKQYTGAFSPNSAIIFYLKQAFKVFNVTFHLLLELRKCSNFHNFFVGFQLGLHHLGSSLALIMLI